jgi:hypothetical protein
MHVPQNHDSIRQVLINHMQRTREDTLELVPPKMHITLSHSTGIGSNDDTVREEKTGIATNIMRSVGATAGQRALAELSSRHSRETATKRILDITANHNRVPGRSSRRARVVWNTAPSSAPTLTLKERSDREMPCLSQLVLRVLSHDEAVNYKPGRLLNTQKIGGGTILSLAQRPTC